MNHLPLHPRNLLFAPAVRPDLVTKMPMSSPDVIAIDLEDATPVNAKADARAALPQLMKDVEGRVPVTIRVNAADSPWFDEDVAALPDGLAAVVVPKIETTEGLDRVAAALRAAGHGLPVPG